MEVADHTAVTGRWRQVLRARDGLVPDGLDLDGVLAATLATVVADLSDPGAGPEAGAAAGAALAERGLAHPDVPVVSAPVLFAAGERLGRPGAQIAAYLTAFGRGHLTHGPAARRAERLEVLFQHASAAIAIGDTEGRLLEANPSLADMIGVPVAALNDISVYDFAHPDDYDNIRTLIYEKLIPAGRGTVSLKQRLVRADGSIGWMNFGITYAAGRGDHPGYLVAVGADVTAQHRHQRELHHQARHDPLTGLPNRRHLMEAINRCYSTADEGDLVGLCFVDLDYFKQINDHWGHTVGDKVLCAVAGRLHDDARRTGDHLVARMGGDEFVALVTPPATEEKVAAVARRLAAAFRDPVVVAGHPLRVTASIGAITSRIARTGVESLLSAADAGLYYAKTNRTDGTTLHADITPDHPPAPVPAPREPAADPEELEQSRWVADTMHAFARRWTIGDDPAAIRPRSRYHPDGDER